jgi:hypothetical protein
LRRLSAVLGIGALLLALSAPAAAHHLVVTPPGGGNGTDHWVGGPAPPEGLPDNAKGRGLHETPTAGVLLAASHSAGPNDDKGLVQACLATRENASPVSFVPPPPGVDTDCKHGEPLP